MRRALASFALILLLSGIGFADNSTTTTGGNITKAPLVFNQTSSWFATCGQLTGAAFTSLAINATAGNVSCVTINTGNSSCSNGTSYINLLFSNSSLAISNVSAGSLAALDAFAPIEGEKGSDTFAYSTTFETSSFGNITSVPTAYTEPSANQSFREGYLQDSSGNLVFITRTVSDVSGFNGTPFDFQALLPTKNGSAVQYFVSVDLKCANGTAPPPPPPPPGPSGSYTVSPQVSIPVYREPPPIEIPAEAPSAKDIRVLRFSPFREVLPGESIIINPLVENPTDRPISITIGIEGNEGSLAAPVSDIFLAPGEKATIPLAMHVPSDLPSGYYSLVMKLTAGESKVNYPSILRVVSVYRVGQPAVKRQFSLDYENQETMVSLTVTNLGDQPIPHLQVYERVPTEFFDAQGNRRFTTGLSSLNGEGSSIVEGRNIRWDVQNILPYESRTIFYKMPLLLTDLSNYRGWNLAQITTIESTDSTEILIRDLQVPTLLPGERGEISMNLFNAGGVEHEVELDVLGPTGWKINPRSVTLSMPSRDVQNVVIMIESPDFAASGTYGMVFRIKYRNTIFDKQVFVYVNEPVVEFYAPPLPDQFMAWMGGNLASVLFFALIVLAGGLVGLAVYRKINQPVYRQERLEDLRTLERMMEQQKK